MSLKERTYSILVVSSTDSFASAFIGSLPEIRYYPVLTASSVSAAKRMLKEKSFDFVIINSPLSDDIGVRFAIDLCSSRQIAVLLLVKRDIHSDIHDKVAEYGVFTLPKPTSKPTLLQALSWMESSRERLRQLEKKSLSIEEKMAEIRLVNKAKWFLISELSMSEPEAHRYIEKQAMDRCIPKRSIADRLSSSISPIATIASNNSVCSIAISASERVSPSSAAPSAIKRAASVLALIDAKRRSTFCPKRCTAERLISKPCAVFSGL